MPMIWMMALSAGQAFMGAGAAKADAAAKKLQFEEQRFNARMQNQIKNREIAKVNAIQWMNNRKIAEAANQERAETDFYLRYNFNNETGELSREYKQTNDQIISALYGKGISPDSGTARAIMRSSMSRMTDVFKARGINLDIGLRSSKRKQEQQLAGRNFGYNAHIPLMQQEYRGADPSSAYSTALMSGLASTAISGFGMAAQADFNADYLAAIQAGGPPTV